MKKKAKQTTYYMHTVEGKPGIYEETDGEPCIFYAAKFHPVRLVRSLRQIRREQEALRAWCEKYKWTFTDFGYIRVRLPDDAEN